jgi:hypothetical protein
MTRLLPSAAHPEWTNRRLLAAVTLGVLLADVALQPVLTGLLGVAVRPAVGIVVVSSLLFGMIGPWSAAVGVVSADLVRATGSVLTGVEAAAVFLIGVTVASVCPPVAASPTGDDRHRNEIADLAAGMVAAVLVGAAVMGWGGELTGVARFAPVVRAELVGSVLGIVVVGVPTVLLFRVVDSDATIPGAATNSERRWSRGRLRTRALQVGIPLVWCVGGFLVTTMLRSVRLSYRQQLQANLPDPLVTAVFLAGPAGRTLQVVAGSIALAAYLWVLPLSSNGG